MQKLIIESSMNVTPEEQLEEKLAPLIADGWRIVSVMTALAPHGEFSPHAGEKYARHVYYVTTVLLEKA